MSTVRGCDICGALFFESSEDWGSGTMTVRRRSQDTGRMETIEMDQDRCGPCNGSTEPRRPNREGNPFPGEPMVAAEQPAPRAIPHYDPNRVAELEEENLRLVQRQNELLHGVNP